MVPPLISVGVADLVRAFRMGRTPGCHFAGMGLICVASDSSHGDVQIFSITELEGMDSSGGFASR